MYVGMFYNNHAQILAGEAHIVLDKIISNHTRLISKITGHGRHYYSVFEAHFFNGNGTENRNMTDTPCLNDIILNGIILNTSEQRVKLGDGIIRYWRSAFERVS